MATSCAGFANFPLRCALCLWKVAQSTALATAHRATHLCLASVAGCVDGDEATQPHSRQSALSQRPATAVGLRLVQAQPASAQHRPAATRTVAVAAPRAVSVATADYVARFTAGTR